jgi:hypothetical protein
MKKQTAVEWVLEQFNEIHTQRKWKEIVEQAKEIEKQQIINTWYDCKLSIIDKNPTDADQYYNETYKK